jgi:Protein of unknown function (DUF4446)
LPDLNTFATSNIGVIVAALTVILVIMFIALLLVARDARRLSQRLDSMTRGAEGQSLEQVLDAHLDRVESVARGLDVVEARTVVLEAGAPLAYQRVGLVRFNPFEDTGGNQSFALALLDGRGTGFVISSLHARSGTRVYGKAVKAGAAESTLSDEEAEAVRQAMATRPGSTGQT